MSKKNKSLGVYDNGIPELSDTHQKNDTNKGGEEHD